jgi:hypothetical protein
MPKLTSALAVLLFAAGSAFPVAAAELAAQKSTDRGVTVVATPQNVAGDARSWDFKIVLDTHTGDLSDDLMKTAVLVDGTGGRHAPIAWDGAGPGGHHREGVLRFKPVSPRPPSLELQIMRSGEAGPRSFRWQLE